MVEMRNSKSISCFLALFFLILFTVSCQPKRKINPISDPKIVFLSNRDGSVEYFDILIMNADGTQQINLTKGWGIIRTSSQPQLSPDQRKVLFLAYEGNHKILTMMDRDGKNKIPLAEVFSDDPQARFSPDGLKIVYVAIINGIRQIHTIESDGRNRVNLSQNQFHEFEPVFSPDGLQITFVSDEDGTSSIFVMHVDGKKRIKLTDASGEDRDPSFSPDGSRIVFSSERNRNIDIYIMRRDGKQLKNLTKSIFIENDPTFHPNGSTILFVSNQRGVTHRDICSIGVKGQSFLNLTYHLNIANYFYDISPNGENIVFASIRKDGCDIYSMDLEGKNQKNLTQHASWDQNPSY